jgi:hypothetical protein
MAAHAQHDLFGNLLHAHGYVFVELLELGFRFARRPPEELRETSVGHRQAVVVREVLHVHLEAAVFLEVDDLPDLVVVLGFAVRRQPHHLILGAVDLEAEIVRERAVEQPQRVREPRLLEELDLGAPAAADSGRGPLPHTVHGDDRGLLERRHQEGAGRVGEVVLDHEHLALVAQLLLDGLRDPHLLAQPQGNRLQERRQRAGERRQVGEQNALELEQRLVVEADVVHLVDGDAGVLETVLDRVEGKILVVADARETLLLRGGDDLPVLEQAGGRVVVVARDAENVHGHS